MRDIRFIGLGLAHLKIATAETELTAESLPAKGLALLCYLTQTGQAQTRSHLAGLFWGDLSETLARTNLRLTLHKLRKCLAEQLDISREAVLLLPGVTSDISEFEQLTRGATLEELRAAAALYSGDLLAGLDFSGAPDFEVWLSGERERLRELARQTFVTLAERCGGSEAQHFAQRALLLAPWDETAHMCLMRLHHEAGDAPAALAQFELLQATLAREFGAQPSTAAQKLVTAINHARLTAHLEPARVLPESATPFLGRAAERAAIHALFNGKTCRLITLVGQGGVGKSRLAIATAAERQDHDRDGVFFVSLVGVNPARDEEACELVLANLASALGMPFSAMLNSDASPLAQLIAFVKSKHCLLVIDNFEQVRSAATVLTQILEASAGVRILVTSRQRLCISAEHVIDIAGLPYASNGAVSDAHALFAEAARRVKPGFDAAAMRIEIDAICALVEGVPLCIELAANWTRALSCAEILARLRADLGLLDAAESQWPERHRSMRRVIESAWQLLTDGEQRAFRRLSICQGGFDIATGLAIAQEPLGTLSALLDKSWLTCDAGRFRIHELLRQFGGAQLLSDQVETATAEAAHAHFFSLALRAALTTGKLRERAALHADRENLRAAWQWHLRAGSEHADKLLPDLWQYYDSTASYQDAVLMMHGALALADVPAMTRIRWTRLLGEAHYQTGAANIGRQMIECALSALNIRIGQNRTEWLAMLSKEIATQATHRIWPARYRNPPTDSARLAEICAGLRQLMHIYYFRGDEIPLAALIMAYLNAAERSGIPDEMAFGYSAASIAFGSIGSHTLGDHYDRMACNAVAHASDPMLTARALQAIGVYHFGAGRIATAKPYLEQAIQTFEKTGGYRYYTECEELLCEIAFYSGDYATAHRLAAAQPLHSASDPLAIAISAFSRAACKLRQCEDVSSECAELLQLKLDTLESSDHVCVYGVLAAIVARQQTNAQNTSRALQFAEQAIMAARQTKMPAIYSIEGYGLLTDALLDICEAQTSLDPAVLRHTEFACDALRKVCRIYPLAQARAALADGRYARLNGEKSAHKHFQRAHRLSKQFCMPWEAAASERYMKSPVRTGAARRALLA